MFFLPREKKKLILQIVLEKFKNLPPFPNSCVSPRERQQIIRKDFMEEIKIGNLFNEFQLSSQEHKNLFSISQQGKNTDSFKALKFFLSGKEETHSSNCP